jgi:polysaccharide export outer membrane protein
MSQKPQIHPETKKPIEPPTFKDVLDGVSVDVLAYNSSVYYVITDGAGLGEQVYRFPVTGSETVLDAISHINGLPVVASPRRIWVARRNPGTNHDSIYPVDWKGISQMGATNTNWQMMPGDRLYVQADPVRRFDNNLGKILSPIERILGATLLGAQTRNALRGVVP